MRDGMNGRDFRALRRALGMTQRELGLALGLAPSSADKTVRNWEDSNPSGPAAVAMTYMAQGALEETMRCVIPEVVFAEAIPEPGTHRELVIRLWRPRFVAVVIEQPLEDFEPVVPIGAEGEWLAVALWIDDPAGFDRKELLQRAAAAFEIYTAESFEAQTDE